MSGVFANGLGISGKAVSAKTIAAFPDVCMTPPENPAPPQVFRCPIPVLEWQATPRRDGDGQDKGQDRQH